MPQSSAICSMATISCWLRVISTLLRPIRMPACRKRPIPARHLANDPGTRVIFS